MTNTTERLITAAGGSGTVIRILATPMTRKWYAHEGKVMGEAWKQHGAEQAGFLVLSDQHFEMARGEFCSNAARAAAILFAQATEKYYLTFTVSGFTGRVRASVQPLSDSSYRVRCMFPKLPTDTRTVTLDDGTPAPIVDLGSIVHVVIEGSFPSDRTAYEQAHRSIMEQLSLGQREAVGVIWFENRDRAIYIHPVVWVNAVDTFFYEGSCGSGTIAVSKVTGETRIVQPTGQTISAAVASRSVSLQSDMRIVA